MVRINENDRELQLSLVNVYELLEFARLGAFREMNSCLFMASRSADQGAIEASRNYLYQNKKLRNQVHEIESLMDGLEADGYVYEMETHGRA